MTLSSAHMCVSVYVLWGVGVEGGVWVGVGVEVYSRARTCTRKRVNEKLKEISALKCHAAERIITRSTASRPAHRSLRLRNNHSKVMTMMIIL